jgi:V/A-type H+-transporting ATPase subunit E
MNGIEKITARILADVQAEADAAKAEAASRCESIRADYDKKAQETYWNLVQTGVRDCEMRVQRLGRAAELEARKSILALKQDMVTEAFDKAVAQVRSMPEDEYVAFLARLAADAASTGSEEILVAESDAHLGAKVAEAANALLAGVETPATESKLAGAIARVAAEATKLLVGARLHYDGNTVDMPGGVIVRDGDVEVNCSIETLVSQYRYELASQVAEVLFGQQQ